jgi:hypothetical protein
MRCLSLLACALATGTARAAEPPHVVVFIADERD